MEGTDAFRRVATKDMYVHQFSVRKEFCGSSSIKITCFMLLP